MKKLCKVTFFGKSAKFLTKILISECLSHSFFLSLKSRDALYKCLSRGSDAPSAEVEIFGRSVLCIVVYLYRLYTCNRRRQLKLEGGAL